MAKQVRKPTKWVRNPGIFKDIGRIRVFERQNPAINVFVFFGHFLTENMVSWRFHYFFLPNLMIFQSCSAWKIVVGTFKSAKIKRRKKNLLSHRIPRFLKSKSKTHFFKCRPRFENTIMPYPSQSLLIVSKFQCALPVFTPDCWPPEFFRIVNTIHKYMLQRFWCGTVKLHISVWRSLVHCCI